MSQATLITSDGSSAGNNLTAGATEYWPVGNAQFRRNATESWMQIPQRSTGTYNGMSATVISSTTGSSSTAAIRKNGSSTAVTVSIGSAVTGDFSDTDTFTVVAGDTVDWQTVAAASGAINFSVFTTTFGADTNTYVNMPWSSNTVNFTTNNATAYHRLGVDGNSAVQTTESTQQMKMRSSVTAKNMYVLVSVNSRPATTVNSRKNTAAGAMSLSITASTTGTFEEGTPHTDSLVATDLYNFQTITGSGTNTQTITEMGCGFESTANQHETSAGIAAGSSYTASGATNYYRPAGDLTANQTTETTFPAPLGGSWSMLRVHLTANTRVAQTLTLRVNTTDTALVASVTLNGTGYFEDTTHSVTVAAGDRISLAMATGVSVNSATIRGIMVLISPRFTDVQFPHNRRADMRHLLTR